jgi:hypothetical protein
LGGEVSVSVSILPSGSVFFTRSPPTEAERPVGPVVLTTQVGLNESPPPQYGLMADWLYTDMFKVLSDILWSESLRIQQDKSEKFEYLSMMSVVTLDSLNTESFCERVLSCVMEYIRASYPDTLRPDSSGSSLTCYRW